MTETITEPRMTFDLENHIITITDLEFAKFFGRGLRGFMACSGISEQTAARQLDMKKEDFDALKKEIRRKPKKSKEDSGEWLTLPNETLWTVRLIKKAATKRKEAIFREWTCTMGTEHIPMSYPVILFFPTHRRPRE